MKVGKTPPWNVERAILDAAGSRDLRYIKLGRLVEVVDAARKIDPEMSLARFLLFLLIAINTRDQGSVTQGTLASRLGVAPASITRNIQALSRSRQRQLGLITAKTDPTDRRQRLLTLTPRGRRVVSDLAGELRMVGFVD